MSQHSARSNAYRKARLKLRAEQRDCWLCHRPIDYTLRYPHPWSFSADHVKPRSQGSGETEHLEAAHLVCNQARGDRTPPPPPTHPSRNWFG